MTPTHSALLQVLPQVLPQAISARDALYESIVTDDISQFKALLAQWPSLAETADEQGHYAVFLAAQYGREQMVKYFVENSRCSFNIEDASGRNPLHYAALSGHVSLVDYLIQYVTLDPFSADYNGKTPIELAWDNNFEDLSDYFKTRYNCTPTTSYKNPVVAGFNPDPSIIRVGEDYFMVTSSFMYFPAIPIYHSTDLVNWRCIGHAVTDVEYLDLSVLEDGRGIWAPDISYHKGRFYITATLRQNDADEPIRRQLVVHAQNPQGPYSKPTYIDIDGIDPSLFTDVDGKRYMLLNRGARLIEVCEDASQVLSEPQLLWYGTNKRAPEAPHLFKREDYYYCLVSEGGTGMGHQVSIARSKNILGPYEPNPHNPILIQRRVKDPIQRSGHGKFVQDHYGNWWIAYLSSRRVNHEFSVLGRETSLDPVRWDAEGWPVINSAKGPSSLQIKPFADSDKKSLKASQVEEATPITLLGHEWVFVRTPDFKRLIQEKHHQVVRIYPDHYDLDAIQKRNLFVKRQTHFSVVADFSLRHLHPSTGCEYGTILYYDTFSYIKFGFAFRKEGPCWQLNWRSGATTESFCKPYKGELSQTHIRVLSNYLTRQFFVKGPTGDYQLLFSLEDVTWLSDEGVQYGKRFTGAMVGLYGIGTQENLDFSYELLSYKESFL